MHYRASSYTILHHHASSCVIVHHHTPSYIVIRRTKQERKKHKLPKRSFVILSFSSSSRWMVAALRFEDFAASVTYRMEKLRVMLDHFGAQLVLEDGESRAFWQGVREVVPLNTSADEALWRVSVRPSAGPRVAAAASAVGGRVLLDWGGGLVWIAAAPSTANHAAISAAALAEGGPAAYRRLFWEAGAIGQALYLEAEAAGLRGTGIGCCFDDGVHQVLGITGHALQSLYHFTVGGPVDDPRLSTLPGYPWDQR
jgi:hypothetical protein